MTKDRYATNLYLLSSQLRPFLASLYKPAIEKATVGMHTDTMELIDKTLSLLVEPHGHLLQDEVVGFVCNQSQYLAKAASAVCEAWEKSESIPFHRLMVYSKRWIKVDVSPVFYDLAADTETTISAKHAPMESSSYPFGAVYGHIIAKRNERKV